MESRVACGQFRAPSIELRMGTLAAGYRPAESGAASSEIRKRLSGIRHFRMLSRT